MKLIIVEWSDSAGINGWHQLGIDDSIAECVEVGILCKEDDKQITLALGHSDAGSYGDTISIPKSCIKRIRKLRVISNKGEKNGWVKNKWG